MMFLILSSGQVSGLDNGFWAVCLSNVTHGGSTEIP